jgi:hypothetical protein
MAFNSDELQPKEYTDEEYLILLANELEKAVKNAEGHGDYIMISNELALIVAKRLRDISEKV